MNVNRDTEIERRVDTWNVSYFEAREQYDAEHSAQSEAEAAPNEVIGDYKNPPFVPRTTEEQAEVDTTNARGKALGEAMLRQMGEERGDQQ